MKAKRITKWPKKAAGALVLKEAITLGELGLAYEATGHDEGAHHGELLARLTDLNEGRTPAPPAAPPPPPVAAEPEPEPPTGPVAEALPEADAEAEEDRPVSGDAGSFVINDSAGGTSSGETAGATAPAPRE